MATGGTSSQTTDAATAEAEVRFREQVWGNLRRNYLAHLFHGMLGQTGFRLIQAPTVIPAYVELLSGSAAIVGVARAVQAFGQCTTPFLSATLVERRRRVLPLGFAIGGAMRLQVLGIALAGFFLPTTLNLIAVCVFLAMFGFFMGMQGVVFNTLMSKVIPVERRGVLSGLRNALAGIVVFSVAWMAGPYLIEPNVWGNGYATTFLVAFALTAAGLAMLLFTREPEAPSVREPSRVRERLRDLPALLRDDRDFTAYFIARAVGTMGRMALPYYILYAREVLAASGSALTGPQIFILTGAWSIAHSTLNLGWGLLADRAGFRIVFLAGMTIWIASALLLMNSASFAALIVVYIGIGMGMGGFMMSCQNLVLEFGTREDLPLRIAVANSSSEFVGGLATLAAGFAVVMIGYEPVFWLAIVFQGTAVAIMARLVREPRHRVLG